MIERWISFLASSPKLGDIVRVRFDPIEGSEQSGERPALVLSPDIINERAPIVLVAPLTSRKTDRVYAFEALIEPPEGGLTERSKAMLVDAQAVAKSRIVGNYGKISDDTMFRVEEALKIATGLTKL